MGDVQVIRRRSKPGKKEVRDRTRRVGQPKPKKASRWMLIWKLAGMARFWIVATPAQTRGRKANCPWANVNERPWREALDLQGNPSQGVEGALDFVPREKIVTALRAVYEEAWGGEIPPAYLCRFPRR